MKKGLLYGISKRGGCPQFVFRVRLLNVLSSPGVKTKYIYLYKQELIRIINNLYHDKSSGDLEELYKIMKRRRERERERERQRRAYQQPLKKRRVCIYQYIYICL